MIDCSDIGNGAAFASQHHDRLRWHVHRRIWLTWDGQAWRDDPGRAVEAAAEETATQLLQHARAITVPSVIATEEDEKESEAVAEARARRDFALQARKVAKQWALESRSQARIASMITRAKYRLAITTQELDADPWILACQNGVLDLRTGSLQEPIHSQLTTRVANVNWDPKAHSEAWCNFVADLSGNDAELAAYLQRATGYMLLGEWREKSFWFAYGPPDGGKSTFLNVLGGVLGGYHTSADAATWMLQQAGGNRGDLVRLAGARLVTTSEIVPGSKFDTALMKKIAGGDPIVAAAKFEGEIEFPVNFALWLAGNDRPLIATGDEGLWRRLQCVPFTHCVPKAKQDRGLAKRLCSPEHAPAVLRWAWEGLQAYLADGLGSCEAVDRANAQYRRDMNPLTLFAEDCLILTGDEAHSAKYSDVRRRYDEWCQENSIRAPLHPATFARSLQDLGCTPKRTRAERLWCGLKLRF